MTRQKDGTAYFIYLADTHDTMLPATIRIASHRPAAGARVTLVGGGTSALEWKADGRGFIVTVPERVRAATSAQDAWAIKVSAIAAQ
jgi:alpha-L-fucosidase